MGEGVRVTVIAEAIWLFKSHEVDCVSSESNEKDFHEEEVKGFPAHKKIDIAGEKDDKIHLLGFVGEP